MQPTVDNSLSISNYLKLHITNKTKILTETQEKSIYSHSIHTEEKGGNHKSTDDENLKYIIITVDLEIFARIYFSQ